MRVRVPHPERCIGCYNCVFACSRELFGVNSPSRTAVFIRSSSLANRFVVVVCPGCKDAPCVSACKEEALQVQPEGGPTLVKPLKCEKCETFDCVKACAIRAMVIDPETRKPVICTQCGLCAKFCPHEVITYGEVKEQ